MMKIDSLNNDKTIRKHSSSRKNEWEELITTGFGEYVTKTMEIYPTKLLKIDTSLSVDQEKNLVTILRKQIDAFAWEYKGMKETHPSIYTHQIYFKKYHNPILQPQIRMNPTLKVIVEEELQKL